MFGSYWYGDFRTASMVVDINGFSATSMVVDISEYFRSDPLTSAFEIYCITLCMYVCYIYRRACIDTLVAVLARSWCGRVV